jgi:lipopolysaccharide/colanic/teichoic acid biosynthesis glycosyltransferase
MQAFLLRVGDVLIVVAVIVFTLPLMVLVALAIKLDSDGPVFAWQPRLGHNGRRFFAVKFRTMTRNAPCETGAPVRRRLAAFYTKPGLTTYRRF